jgi:hypothetical protein
MVIKKIIVNVKNHKIYMLVINWKPRAVRAGYAYTVRAKKINSINLRIKKRLS